MATNSPSAKGAETERQLLEQLEALKLEVAALNEELEYRRTHGGRKKRIPGRVDDVTDYQPLIDGPLTMCDECGHLYTQSEIRVWRRNDAWMELLLCAKLCLPKALDGQPLKAYATNYPGRKQV